MNFKEENQFTSCLRAVNISISKLLKIQALTFKLEQYLQMHMFQENVATIYNTSKSVLVDTEIAKKYYFIAEIELLFHGDKMLCQIFNNLAYNSAFPKMILSKV